MEPTRNAQLPQQDHPTAARWGWVLSPVGATESAGLPATVLARVQPRVSTGTRDTAHGMVLTVSIELRTTDRAALDELMIWIRRHYGVDRDALTLTLLSAGVLSLGLHEEVRT